MNFKKVGSKAVVSKILTLKLEIDLNDSGYTAEDAASRIEYLIHSYNAKEFSELIAFLLRETKSSTWEMKKLEVV